MISAEDEREIEVRVDEGSKYTIEYNSDKFAKSGDELRNFGGVSPAVKQQIGRKIQKAHTGSGSHSKKVEKDQIDAYNIFGLVHPPYNLDYLAKLYEVSPPHYAAVDAKVANIVGLGFEFVESDLTRDKVESAGNNRKTGLRRKLGRHKTELYKWLDDCNKEDEFVETLIKVWTDRESTGNGYLEIGRKNTGEIGYLGHVPATTMRIRKVRDGFVQIVGKEMAFFRNFGDRTTSNPIGGDRRPNEIIHFKKYSPTHGFYGIPSIIAAKQAVAGNEFSARFNLDYFENKAVPRYVIVVKGGSLSDGSQKKLLEFFQTGLKGKNHRTLYVPLPADDEGKKVEFDMKSVEAGIQDASFKNYNQSNLNEILMAPRVPIGKIGGSPTGISLAASRDSDKTFKEQVCRPEQKIVEKKLNKIVGERTDAFRLKLTELTLTDENTLSQMDERYLRMHVMTPNDIRVRRWGWDGLEDGDETIDLTSQQRAEQATQASGNRRRDQDRSSNQTDNEGEARNPQGEGRTQA